MRDAVAAVGVDMSRLDADLTAHDKAITALLRRNNAQAKALGLEGTPVYLIGPYLVASALDYDGFAEVVGKFRERIGK
jgi:protein-disulfide isomerase